MGDKEERYSREEIQQGILGAMRGKKRVSLESRKEANYRDEEPRGVWVALEIEEEGEALRLREILGRDYDVNEVLNIKKDKYLHKQFELMCWEYLVEQEIRDEDNLYQMLELIMGTKSGQVMQAKVDSELNEVDQEVYITYKVKVNA